MDSSNLRNQLDQVKEGTSEQEEAVDQATEDDQQEENDEQTDPSVETTDAEKTATGPAFTAQTSEKLSIYPSEDNARFIKVLCNSVENDLIALGHDDFEVREAHDAMVRFAYEHPQEVTQLVLEARDLDPDDIKDLP